MNQSPPGSLLDESGLSRFVLPLTDRQFVVALGAALPVWIALGLGVGGSLYRPVALAAWLAFVLWQPLLEEVVFRGILQGQMLRLLDDRRLVGVTVANWLTTALFAVMHLLAQPPAWALAVAVAVPSLVAG